MRIYSLEPIRFGAALLVVLYHFISNQSTASEFPILHEFTKFGYLGVPLFFIVSGFVIAISADNRGAFEFGISRFLRLYPTFWLCLFLTVAVSLSFSGETYTIFQILTNLTLLNEYFGTQNIDAVYWTLKAELRFYFCVFLLILFKVYEKTKVWLTIWTILVILYTLTGQPFFLSWFISPEYSSFFIAGITFYLIRKNGVDLYNTVMLSVSLAISLLNAGNQIEGFIVNPDLADKIIALSLITLNYLVFFLIAIKRLEFGSNTTLLILGGLTYPLYLLHNVAGKLIIQQLTDYLSKGWSITLTILLMLLTSWIIFAFFEKKVVTALKNKVFSFVRKNRKLLLKLVRA